MEHLVEFFNFNTLFFTDSSLVGVRFPMFFGFRVVTMFFFIVEQVKTTLMPFVMKETFASAGIVDLIWPLICRIIGVTNSGLTIMNTSHVKGFINSMFNFMSITFVRFKFNLWAIPFNQLNII
jgi:hypothetical protein